MSNMYLVKISGEVYVGGEAHSDVKECLRNVHRFDCEGTLLKFLDIEKITLVEQEDNQHEQHGTGRVRPVDIPTQHSQEPSVGRGQPPSVEPPY